jgi:hypothetical protein
VRAEGPESHHTAGGPTGYLHSATNIHVKSSSAIEHAHSVEQSFFLMHCNVDDDDDNFDGDDNNNNK